MGRVETVTLLMAREFMRLREEQNDQFLFPQHIDGVPLPRRLINDMEAMLKAPPNPRPWSREEDQNGIVNAFETQTNITRGEALVSLLRQQGSVSFAHSEPVATLVVGVGYSEKQQCSYVPAKLAAQFDDLSMPYSLTLADISRTVLDKALQQRQIRVSPDSLEDKTTASMWRRYIEQVGVQSDRSGIPRTAPLPASLERKLSEGEVQALEGDIQLLPLGKPEQYNIIICENVLIYIGKNRSDKLALLNMLRSLAIGGWLSLLDDRKYVSYNEWLDDEGICKQLGVRRIYREEQAGAVTNVLEKFSHLPPYLNPEPIIARYTGSNS